MRSDAIASGIGNAGVSSLGAMRCGTALGKLPLVLAALPKVAIDESPESVAKLIFIAQLKLTAIHCFISEWPSQQLRRKPFDLQFASS